MAERGDLARRLAAEGTGSFFLFATVIGYTPAARAPAWRDSAGATILEAALQALIPLLPEGVVLPQGRA
jgi:hypothetical protein